MAAKKWKKEPEIPSHRHVWVHTGQGRICRRCGKPEFGSSEPEPKAKPTKRMKKLIEEANKHLLDPNSPGWTEGANRILAAIGSKARLSEHPGK